MDNRIRARDYALLVPLLVGIISLLGICSIIMSIRTPRHNDQIIPSQTVTPFKYLLLATFTPFPSIGFESASHTESLPAPTETSAGDAALIPPLAEQTEIPVDDFLTPTITITPNLIFAESDPMSVGKYDDTDSEIIRNGNWESKKNVISYQETLLISNTVGNYVVFSFVGQQMVLGYQSSDDAGEMLVNIDGAETAITQLIGNAWFSQELQQGTHFVILTHLSGASINLDYIDIPSER